MFESLLVVLLLFVSVFYLFFLNIYSYWRNRGIPYERPIIPYGNSKGVNKAYHLVDLTQRLYNKFKGEAPMFGMYTYIRPVAVITDLDLIKNILIKDFNYFADKGLYYNERDDPLSAHLFSLDGPQWRFMRTKLSPTFTSGKMKYMFPTILEVANELENLVMGSIETDTVLEIREIVARYTTDVIGCCAFGIECNSLKDPNAEFRARGRELFRKQRNGPFLRAFMQAFPNLARMLRMKTTRDVNSKFFLEVVRQTVKYREENEIRRNDFLDLLLEIKNGNKEGDGLSLGQIAAQVFLFFIAGFETSSTTMGYCLYELALSQEVQDKLRAEIKDVLTKHDGKFTYEATLEMTYMDKVINETLRKYPPVPVLFRKAIKNYQIEGTKFSIEKGTSIIIPNHAIQNDPQYYPNPDIFDPDRFSTKSSQERHPCAFLPFGDGPRNCIGLRFGRMQARVGLAKLVNRFKFNLCESTQIPMKYFNGSFILMPETGIDLKVEKV